MGLVVPKMRAKEGSVASIVLRFPASEHASEGLPNLSFGLCGLLIAANGSYMSRAALSRH